jgi:hypothetical protein
MMRKTFCLTGLILLFGSSIFAQHNFEIKDASKYFDIKISVEGCEEQSCEGRATFSFYKKGDTTPYQVINHEETFISLWDEGKTGGGKLPYGRQSVVNVGDYNFDGMEDIAICNGRYGNYGAQSYEVYLSSGAAGKFVHNKHFSELGQNYMGLFEVDNKKKILKVFHKGGCCWHGREEYKILNNRPVKIFYEEEDATLQVDTRVKITTGTFINGKWRRKIRYVRRKE